MYLCLEIFLIRFPSFLIVLIIGHEFYNRKNTKICAFWVLKTTFLWIFFVENEIGLISICCRNKQVDAEWRIAEELFHFIFDIVKETST